MQETVSIIVTDDGIGYFEWEYCAQVVETVSENTELLPFDQLQSKLKDVYRNGIPV